MSIAAGGDVWTTSLPNDTALLTGEQSELRVYRSTDGGRTWSDLPASLGNGHDHPTRRRGRDRPRADEWRVRRVDDERRGASGKSRSALAIARSSDGSRTFAAPARVVASNLSHEAHAAALFSDGMLAVSFADHHRRGDRRRLPDSGRRP